MEQMIETIGRFSDRAVILISFLAALFAIIGAIRSGMLKRVRFGSFEIVASEREKREAHALIGSLGGNTERLAPFETGQLASYYAQVLVQSKISFWFSLIFASLGFLIIVVAAFMYSGTDSGSTIARFIAGAVVDAVAALFFVQSRNAQQSMADFSDKLRRDRNHVEARKLCESLETARARDALRLRLSLHYAEVSSSENASEIIMKTCLMDAEKEK